VDAERESRLFGGHVQVSSLRATALPDIPHKLEDLHRQTAPKDINHAVVWLAGYVAQMEGGGKTAVYC
jgi:hypothetical protein